MLIDKPTLARMVPHAGAMCLLDGVLRWDATQIRCVTASHRARDNPLRREGQLGILCGVEYAAQAMAVHGALAANDAEHHRPTSDAEHHRPSSDAEHHRPSSDAEHHRPTNDAEHHRPTNDAEHHRPSSDAEHHRPSSGAEHAGPRGGFLASLRAVTCHVDRLDLLAGTMIVEAERVHGDAGRAIYRFALSHQDQVLLTGRAAVVLQETT